MLNRRLLRIKAMQSVYAFKQSLESNYQMGMDKIKEAFQEELLELGQEEKDRIQHEEQLVIAYYNHNYSKGTSEVTSEELDEKMLGIGNKSVLLYRNLKMQDFESYMSKMVQETERLYYKYLKFLNYLIELSETVKVDLEEKISRGTSNIASDQLLFHSISENEVFQTLAQHQKLNVLISEHKLRRAEDVERVRDWVRLMKKDETFMDKLREYSEKRKEEENTSDLDKEVARLVVRDFLFKNEVIDSSFEDEDLNWAENRNILKSMVQKTLKNIEQDSEAELLSISKNWEEDKVFFVDLYKFTLREEDDYEEVIEKNSKKWAKDRMAKIDSILIVMAIVEMVHFPNIPVKVTINEFIEISKHYSTPKSWQFINGMLDSISEQLIKEGVIKKSGRGLLDNK